MTRFNNVVKIIEFKDDMDLYSKLDHYLRHSAEKDCKSLSVKSIHLIDDNHAFVYMEEDTNALAVKFIHNGEEIILEQYPYFPLLLPYAEIEIIRDLGKLTIEDTTYEIKSVQYSINSSGGRYITIILS